MLIVEDQIKDLVPFLKERGLRITPQRMLILQAIQELDGHSTIEEIHKKLSYISLATIYNNVKLFVRLGILSELPYGNGLSQYEIYQSHHYHVTCENCGKIVDFHYPNLKEVEQVAAHLTKYEITRHQLAFYGKCRTCQQLGS
mgnify:CR=1 FL=1